MSAVSSTNSAGTAHMTAAEVEAHYGCDLMTVELIRHALEHVSLQMQMKLNAGALSPLLSELNDFGIGLLGPRDLERDLDFDAIAMATAAPTHYVINQFYGRMAIEEWGADNFAPGDVILYNDPYRGGSHVNDVGTLMPIFDGDELMGFAVAITHWLDIGGPAPTGFGPGLQRDMYAEGIRLSPRHLYRGGELVKETVDLFTLQTRIPEMSINDLQVIRASLAIGVDMVQHYVQRYGREAYKAAVQYNLDYSERAVRNALTKIPDGEYHAQDNLDNNMDGEPMPVRCTVRKRGDEIEIDFSGSCREEWGGYCCQWSDTVSAAHVSLQAMLPETVSANAGAYRPIHVVVPPGSCFHALPPMSTNAGHLFFLVKAVTLVKKALSQASPDLAVGENCDDFPVMSFSGLDERGEMAVPYVHLRIFAGPYGGTALGDGCAFTVAEGGNAAETSIELDEETYPIIIVGREFVADTAGAGRHRGGPAMRSLVCPLGEAESFYQMDQCRFPTEGVMGGGHGALAHIVVYRDALADWAQGQDLGTPEVLAGIVDSSGALVDAEAGEGTLFRLSKRTGVRFGPGDIVALQVPGGGGWGDPVEREAADIERDLENGLYTEGGATAAYGSKRR